MFYYNILLLQPSNEHFGFGLFRQTIVIGFGKNMTYYTMAYIIII